MFPAVQGFGATGQIAAKLEGRQFNDWDAFRRAFWREVARDPELASQFGQRSVDRMRQGVAPLVSDTQRADGRTSYDLHHIQPIGRAGGVYDMNNVVIVTPRLHREMLDNGYHYGGK